MRIAKETMNCLTVILVTLVATPAFAAIRFTLVHYRGSNLNNEYVFIKNTGSSRVRMTGWRLKDASVYRYTFPMFRLGGGRSVTIHTGHGSDTRSDLYWGSGPISGTTMVTPPS
jgi:hypothetical protein